MIGSDNYVTRNDRHGPIILHTILDGDNRDIRVIKPEDNNVWSSNHSLPNAKGRNLNLHTRNDMVSGLSPIMISFSDTGEHFVNMTLNKE